MPSLTLRAKEYTLNLHSTTKLRLNNGFLPSILVDKLWVHHSNPRPFLTRQMCWGTLVILFKQLRTILLPSCIWKMISVL
jgi:hypothetical protein